MRSLSGRARSLPGAPGTPARRLPARLMTMVRICPSRRRHGGASAARRWEPPRAAAIEVQDGVEPPESVSARRLAAEIWWLQALPNAASGGPSVGAAERRRRSMERAWLRPDDLHSELRRARDRITKLEAERSKFKTELDRFLRALVEEKAAWRRREHDKAERLVVAAREDIVRERTIRRRVEVVNAKLVGELADAKSAVERCLWDWEEERKARELAEEVCDELAKQLAGDRDEAEGLKGELRTMREEREMMQVAEVWREERARMKMADAKVVLEEMNAQLGDIQGRLDAFLARHGGGDRGSVKEVMEEAERIKVAAASVEVPMTEAVFAVFDDGHRGGSLPASTTGKRGKRQGLAFGGRWWRSLNGGNQRPVKVEPSVGGVVMSEKVRAAMPPTPRTQRGNSRAEHKEVTCKKGMKKQSRVQQRQALKEDTQI